MANLTHLPHVRNIKTAVNRWDPVHSAVFEVYISLPEAIRSEFAETEALLTEQVVSVSGLDALQKNTPVGKQRFMGADVSHAGPVMDDTRANFTIVFNLNLRDVTDNFVYKAFYAWKNLNYNLTDGTRTLKRDYISEVIRIAEANRDGTVWRSTVFNDILLENATGLDTLDYTDNEPKQLTCTFWADYFDMDVA